ncbi:MAG TPA: hypothetical protein VN281_11505 [Verrucomicrobiae bacterium]|jgi:hypothetical protein|nr:hypothetical protein [Verrucomicrobiae bacterium]
MNNLLDITNAADRAAVAESNFQILDASLAFALSPTLVNGVPNAIVGPPIVGTFVQDFLWVDSLRAIFRCTVAGTPGTWIQVKAAIVTVATVPVGPPVNYLITIPSQKWISQYYDGANWQNVFLTPSP